MGSSSLSRVLFFCTFFTVITLGLRQFHSASATRKISFRFLFGYPFRKEKERKNPRKSRKETVAPADCCHWENQRKPHKYRDLSRRTTERKRENGRTQETEKMTWKLDWKQNGFLYFGFKLRKEKEEEKKKRDAGKGKEEGTKMRSGVADGGRPEGKWAEHPCGYKIFAKENIFYYPITTQ